MSIGIKPVKAARFGAHMHHPRYPPAKIKGANILQGTLGEKPTRAVAPIAIDDADSLTLPLQSCPLLKGRTTSTLSGAWRLWSVL